MFITSRLGVFAAHSPLMSFHRGTCKSGHQDETQWTGRTRVSATKQQQWTVRTPQSAVRIMVQRIKWAQFNIMEVESSGSWFKWNHLNGTSIRLEYGENALNYIHVTSELKGHATGDRINMNTQTRHTAIRWIEQYILTKHGILYK